MRNFFFLVIILSIVSIFVYFDIFSSQEENELMRHVSEKRAIFISYIELNQYLKGESVIEDKKAIDLMIDRVYQLGFNMIILQVRSFSDAIYPSSIFPWSSTVSSGEGVNPGYDVLKYFLKKTHQKNMMLYAWINPYRIRSTEDVFSITDINPAFSYLNTDTIWIKDGIYYNPSKIEVENLIVSGVLELVKNYSVDGVLFDDYFYPSQEIDLEDYQNYLNDHDNLSLSDYHLMIINRMVMRVHDVCKQAGVSFGISPDGNISNNYDFISADVKTWVQSDQYVDFIMPQIYYGFYHEVRAFKETLDEWSSMITSNQVDLLVALAFYKVGVFDTYAKKGSMEWMENDDMIMREILLARNVKHYVGFALFRYDYLINEELQTNTTMMEIENMKKILK